MRSSFKASSTGIFLTFALIISLSGRWAFAEGVSTSETKYEKIKTFLKTLEAQYPQHVKSVTIGTSDQGENIIGVAIGNGPVKNLVVATHHGNEYGSTEVAKAFAQSVAAAPIQGQTLYVIPVLNVAGYNASRRWESDKTGSSRDPNRDYPGPCGSEGPFRLKSTAALAKFIEETGIVASATLHTYYPAVVYPWGFATRDLSTPYDDLYIDLAQAATAESRYTVGNSTDVIYAASGTYEDYVFWKHGVWSLLFEVGSSHSPSPAAVQEMIRVNVPGLRNMMERSPRERAERHDFTGSCSKRLAEFDRHDE